MQDKIIVPDDKKWAFDEDVTKCFDDMLERSIPAYTDMRELVKRIGKKYVKPRTQIIDLGCSTGQSAKPFISEFKNNNQFKLYDVSKPMLEECRRRYEKEIKAGVVSVEYFDIRNGIDDYICASLILGILTIQFTPIEYRQKIIQSIYNGLAKGGAFIFVEKVLGANYDIDSMMIDEYYSIKSENQYTQEQIQAKRKSLEGVLVPITAKWNEDMLKEAGFKKIDCFWRYLNFCGWVAIK